MGASFDSLWTICEEVFYPGADGQAMFLAEMSGMIILKAELKSVQSIFTSLSVVSRKCFLFCFACLVCLSVISHSKKFRRLI